jgi:N utilization substance protein B
MGIRRKARELALQMLFQADLGRQGPEQVRKTFWAERSQVDEAAHDFAEELFRVATGRAAEIDALIGRHAEHWRMERMAAVDRNILRAGVAEFLAMETPKPVVINEALEIARRFSAPESIHFINGVLDSIAREMTTAGDAEGAARERQKEKGKRKKKVPS